MVDRQPARHLPPQVTPQRLHRLTVGQPCNVCNTSTEAITAAGTDGRPRPDGNRSANIPSGNTSSRWPIPPRGLISGLLGEVEPTCFGINVSRRRTPSRFLQRTGACMWARGLCPLGSCFKLKSPARIEDPGLDSNRLEPSRLDPAGPDVAQPEPHSRCSGPDRDAGCRTPTPTLTSSPMASPRSIVRLATGLDQQLVKNRG